MTEFTAYPGDLVEDGEGDKAVVVEASEDGLRVLAVEWDCRPGVVARVHPSFQAAVGFSNLSERVRELDAGKEGV